MVDEIFYDNDMRFDDLIHNEIRNVEFVKSNGINNFLLNYIRKYDIELSNYIACNIDILNGIRKDFEKVLTNWNKYIDIMNKRKVDICNYELYRYVSDKCDIITIPEYFVMNYVISKLKLNDIFDKYINYFDNIDSDGYYNRILNSREYKEFFDIENIKNMSFANVRFIRHMLEFTEKLFKDRIIKEDRSDYDVETPKVISFKYKK